VRALVTTAAALLVALLGSAIAPAPGAAQRVERVGSGAASVDARLDDLLAGRYLLVARDTTFAATDTVPGPVLVLGARLIVEGVVAGDLIVVDGEAYLRPTARVIGDAVNIGGGSVYSSSPMSSTDRIRPLHPARQPARSAIRHSPLCRICRKIGRPGHETFSRGNVPERTAWVPHRRGRRPR